MLQVAVYQGLYDEPFLGSYVLADGALRWEGAPRSEGGVHGEPFDPRDRVGIDGKDLYRPILATDDYRDGWIVPEDDPERWLRRVPGFLDMRGTRWARIVRDTTDV